MRDSERQVKESRHDSEQSDHKDKPNSRETTDLKDVMRVLKYRRLNEAKPVIDIPHHKQLKSLIIQNLQLH